MSFRSIIITWLRNLCSPELPAFAVPAPEGCPQPNPHWQWATTIEEMATIKVAIGSRTFVIATDGRSITLSGYRLKELALTDFDGLLDAAADHYLDEHTPQGNRFYVKACKEKARRKLYRTIKAAYDDLKPAFEPDALDFQRRYFAANHESLDPQLPIDTGDRSPGAMKYRNSYPQKPLPNDWAARFCGYYPENAPSAKKIQNTTSDEAIAALASARAKNPMPNRTHLEAWAQAATHTKASETHWALANTINNTDAKTVSALIKRHLLWSQTPPRRAANPPVSMIREVVNLWQKAITEPDENLTTIADRALEKAMRRQAEAQAIIADAWIGARNTEPRAINSRIAQQITGQEAKQFLLENNTRLSLNMADKWDDAFRTSHAYQFYKVKFPTTTIIVAVEPNYRDNMFATGVNTPAAADWLTKQRKDPAPRPTTGDRYNKTTKHYHADIHGVPAPTKRMGIPYKPLPVPIPTCTTEGPETWNDEFDLDIAF